MLTIKIIICMLIEYFMQGEDDSGLPISIIKPSEIAKLNLSNPTISPNIAR